LGAGATVWSEPLENYLAISAHHSAEERGLYHHDERRDVGTDEHHSLIGHHPLTYRTFPSFLIHLLISSQLICYLLENHQARENCRNNAPYDKEQQCFSRGRELNQDHGGCKNGD